MTTGGSGRTVMGPGTRQRPGPDAYRGLPDAYREPDVRGGRSAARPHPARPAAGPPPGRAAVPSAPLARTVTRSAGRPRRSRPAPVPARAGSVRGGAVPATRAAPADGGVGAPPGDAVHQMCAGCVPGVPRTAHRPTRMAPGVPPLPDARVRGAGAAGGPGRPCAAAGARSPSASAPFGRAWRPALTANSPGTGMAPACLRVRVHEYEGRGVPEAARGGARRGPTPRQNT
ncbi:hypothetical protein GCM10010358_00510 [Streptomyces minutiscleroticus]|uniref:Uncharacterized protein n=1 Tax=Streptomyces minutiscleroticus TaxID=68238 RepID=A0A918N9D7_9ACTN|nr:hypothetical protein GCM10010358_00510 [Streptomyces minutiscleroticus]